MKHTYETKVPESHKKPKHSQAKEVFKNAESAADFGETMGNIRPRMKASKSLD
jgi:hypothetical protein